MRQVFILSAVLLVTGPLYAAESAWQKAGRHLCLGCHAVDETRVGPAFQDVATHYRAQKDPVTHLVRSVQQGSAGKWGTTPMPPEIAPNDDLIDIVEWIMQQ